MPPPVQCDRASEVRIRPETLVTPKLILNASDRQFVEHNATQSSMEYSVDRSGVESAGEASGPRSDLRAGQRPPTDFGGVVNEPVNYGEVMGLIRETLELEQESVQEAPCVSEAQANKPSRKIQMALPLSKGIVKAAEHFLDQLKDLPPVDMEQIRVPKRTDLPKFPRGYGWQHPLYRGSMSRDPAATGKTFEQLCKIPAGTSELRITDRTMRSIEHLNRAQVATCSHLDLQLRSAAAEYRGFK